MVNLNFISIKKTLLECYQAKSLKYVFFLQALTATATPRVREDIVKQLGMENTKWFLTSFNRSNLQYEVRPKKGKGVLDEIIQMIKRGWPKKSGIVYCFSRKECEDVAAKLRENGNFNLILCEM